MMEKGLRKSSTGQTPGFFTCRSGFFSPKSTDPDFGEKTPADNLKLQQICENSKFNVIFLHFNLEIFYGKP